MVMITVTELDPNSPLFSFLLQASALYTPAGFNLTTLNSPGTIPLDHTTGATQNFLLCLVFRMYA
jgi:hypothetical protein